MKCIRVLCLTVVMQISVIFSCAPEVWSEEAETLVPPVLPVLTSFDLQIYVDPTGDDNAAGTQTAPLKSLSKALEKAAQRPDNTSVVIRLSGAGRQEFAQKVAVTGLKGTAEKPIVICGVEREGTSGGPILSGAAGLANWVRLTDSDYYKNATEAQKARFIPDVVDRLWVAPLTDSRTTQWDNPVTAGRRPEFFVNGKPETIARWPNEDFATLGDVFGATVVDSWAGPGCKEGIVSYLDDRQDRWANEPDAWCCGYWFWDWAEEYLKIDSIDRQNKRITFCEPWHNYGYRKGARYFGLNLLCELDAPGEYYIDRDAALLFWYPKDVNPNECDTVLSCYNDDFMLTLQDCCHVIVANLKFEYGRKGAVQFKNCEDCLLVGDSFYGFGGGVVAIQEGRNSGVFGCRLEMLGAGGVAVSGGDRRSLVSCGNYVENSIIKTFSRVKRTYAPAVSVGGCGVRVGSNVFEDSSSSAIGMSGNDHLIEKNITQDVIKESDDQGGIDIWYDPTFRGNVVRYNYWKNIVGGTQCGAAGIRLDDIISGFHIYGNVFEHCGSQLFGAIQIHGGKDNILEDNLFFNCHAAVSFSPWHQRYLDAIQGAAESLSKESLNKKMYEYVDIRSELWQNRYPELARIMQDPDVNFVKNNLAVNCKTLFLRDEGMQKVENTILVQESEATLDSLLNSNLFEEHNIKRPPFEEMGNYPFQFLIP
ncbi:MAG: right-handed parallel beta-helix repeat-containing protein [Planctomycetia bacterium]|nr:right-handed parallel beta-helix repeat-containing protein [Planctomycetia bacterium]